MVVTRSHAAGKFLNAGQRKKNVKKIGRRKKAKKAKKNESLINAYLKKMYYTSNEPGSFAGAYKLYRQSLKEGKYKISLNEIQKWLKKQEIYTLYKRKRDFMQRSTVNTMYPGFLLDTDLLSMQGVAKHNNGYGFVLVVIDTFSRYLWARALPNKEGKTVAKALLEILNSVPYKVERLRSDNGSEYKNTFVKELLKKKGIRIQYTNNETKANYAEACIRTLKSKIYKYFNYKQTYKYTDILQDIVKSYNNTYHTGIKRAPADINMDNAAAVWWALNLPRDTPVKRQANVYKPGKFKYSIGDNVRVSYEKGPFTREYHEKWSEEIYIIRDRKHREGIPVYKLMDYNSTEIKGTFYENEIQGIILDSSRLWKVEKILKERKKSGKKQYLIRWSGWGEAFDSWIWAKELEDYRPQ